MIMLFFHQLYIETILKCLKFHLNSDYSLLWLTFQLYSIAAENAFVHFGDCLMQR